MDMSANISGVESLEDSLGQLKNDWAEGREIAWVVGTSMEYAVPVEYGRGPITADDGYLHFTVDGKEIFTKSVDAAPAQPYMRPATEQTKQTLDEVAGRARSYQHFMKLAARKIERKASEFVPVDDGDLKASIGARRVA